MLPYTLHLWRDAHGPVVEIECNGGRYPLDPAPSQKLRNHSPDGFEWGYMGSGPSQLALAILLHHTQKRDIAQNYYMDFKTNIIASIPKKGGQITSHQIEAFLNTVAPK